MQRRKAISGIALTLGSFVSLPTWASSWNAATIGKQIFSSVGNEAILAALVDVIIPKTETLGAKELNVHQFVQRMITDCYDKKAQANFEKNLTNTEELCTKAFGKSFSACEAAQQADILKSMALSTDSEAQNFYKTLRGLTIQGYTTSEYYLTNFTDYTIAPGHFYGSVPVKK